LNADELLGLLDRTVSGGSWVEPLTSLVSAFVFGQLLAWTVETATRTASMVSRGRGRGRGRRGMRDSVARVIS